MLTNFLYVSSIDGTNAGRVNSIEVYHYGPELAWLVHRPE